MTPTATTAPADRLLNPDNHSLILIDHQPQMAFATASIDITLLRVNVSLVATAARDFKTPTILTTVEEGFSGPVFSEIKAVFPDAPIYERSSMNAWEHDEVTAAVNQIGRSKIVMAGLWTSVCIVGPVLSALEQGFEVYVITDACGDVSTEAHERAIARMIQVGAQPMTAMQYLLELQRDWSRKETYDATVAAAMAFGGAYGVGLQYAYAQAGAK